eukprot:2918748-Rhodomonas_salina.3
MGGEQGAEEGREERQDEQDRVEKRSTPSIQDVRRDLSQLHMSQRSSDPIGHSAVLIRGLVTARRQGMGQRRRWVNGGTQVSTPSLSSLNPSLRALSTLNPRLRP